MAAALRVSVMPEHNWETLAAQAGYRPGELAKICQTSLRTLQRHFRADYGMTLGNWLRELRMRTAYARITAGESVKEIAYDLSFKQLSHFSRVFKQAYGVPPSTLSMKCGARLKKMEAPQPFAEIELAGSWAGDL